MPRTGRPPKPAVERFSRQIQVVPSGCVEWIGHIDRYGYGQFRPGGRNTAHVGAHRWAYEHFIGPISPGFQVDHLCRNRKCVNPDHLESVTPRENTMRGLGPASLNAKKTHCIKGHPFSDANTSTYGTRRVCKDVQGHLRRHPQQQEAHRQHARHRAAQPGDRDMSDQPTCGRCGVYRHLHPTPTCAKSRYSFWWDRHYLWRHIAGAIWLSLGDRRRFDIASRYHDRRPHLCWCDLVDAAYLDIKRDEYRGKWGCLCDVPLPTDASEPRPEGCYCTPAATTTGA